MSTFFFHLGCLMFEFLFTVPIRLGKKSHEVNVKYVWAIKTDHEN